MLLATRITLCAQEFIHYNLSVAAEGLGDVIEAVQELSGQLSKEINSKMCPYGFRLKKLS